MSGSNRSQRKDTRIFYNQKEWNLSIINKTHFFIIFYFRYLILFFHWSFGYIPITNFIFPWVHANIHGLKNALLRYLTFANTLYIVLWYSLIKINPWSILPIVFHNIIVFHHGNNSRRLSMARFFQGNHVLISDTHSP